MKKIYSLFIFCCMSFVTLAQSLPSIHGYTAVTIQGNTINLSQYYGKKIMLVNTASFCAYTPQFGDLEQLYSSYKQHNFEILGFPCNDFGGQDPNHDSIINNFCTSNYNVTFQMMSKIAIIANDTSPVYKWLQRSNLNGKQNVGVAWNFNKFLINETGNWVAHHASTVNPLDTSITHWILSATSVTAGIGSISNSGNLFDLVSANPVEYSIDLRIASGLLQPVNVGLYSVDGKLVKEVLSKTISTPEKTKIDVSDLEAGFYFIVAENGLTRKTIRIVIAK
jgi:glutathione peroxidase